MPCPHDVYNAWGCQQCNPPGSVENAAVPVLPRSSANPLNATKTDKQELCPECECVRVSFSNDCPACGYVYPADDYKGRAQDSANEHAQGTCPKCNSAVHYEKNSRIWVCADCDTEYKAPKNRKTQQVKDAD